MPFILFKANYFKDKNWTPIFLFMMAGFIFFVPTSVGKNELPKGLAKAPKECLRQKGPFSSAGMPAAKGVFYPE